jgi:hypothetical protein
MAFVAGNHHPVIKELTKAGIIPQRCRRCVIDMGVYQAVTVTSEVLVTEEEFRAIADALIAHKETLQHRTLVQNEQTVQPDARTPGQEVEVLDISVLGKDYAEKIPGKLIKP